MLKRLRWSGVVLALAMLAGCTGMQQVWDRMTSDPVESALLVIEDQWTAARQEFYQQDAAAIRACLASGLSKSTCSSRRCETAACLTFRLTLDPKVTAAYNLAQQVGTAASVEDAGAKAIGAFDTLAVFDPSRAAFYGGLRAFVEQALRTLAERAARPPAVRSAATQPTPGAARGAALS